MPRGITTDVMTPPAIVAALAAGYRPYWHPSADGIPAVAARAVVIHELA